MGNIQFWDNKILFGDKDGNNTDKIAMHPDCCCGNTVSCPLCENEVAASEYDIVLAGILDGVCEECGLLNAPRRVTYVGHSCDGVGIGEVCTCTWDYDFPEIICDGQGNWLGIRLCIGGTKQIDGFSDWFVSVELDDWEGAGDNWVEYYRKNYAAPIDCDALNNEALPQTYFGASWCEWWDSTCHVSAVV